MKELLQMMQCLIQDIDIKCSAKNWSRDNSTLRRRVSDEGLSFMTITLPTFSDTFFQCLEKGVVTSFDFVGWKKKGYLPAFLQGYTSLVFDQHTGVLLDEPNIKSIHAIRQVCNLYKKISIPCTAARERKTLTSYCTTDSNMGIDSFRGDQTIFDLFERVSRVVVSTIAPEEPDVNHLVPHHGPGSTYEKVVGNKKFRPSFFNWYNQLNDEFDESCLFNTDESYHLSTSEYRSTLPYSSVRVITVPKTQKGPRVIAMEPVVIQFTQQSIKDYLVKKIEQSPLTSGHVNFRDQSINQRLALESSKTRALATLDLSEASDRVCAKHVYRMLAVNPKLRSLVFCTRSHVAEVLGEQVYLNKFASMGSALCFPIESLYFFIIIVTGLLDAKKLQPTYTNIMRVSRSVYVYGDDIIIPTNVADAIVATLTKFGNVVSQKKSFINSNFRESCGTDAYDGENITPVYIRHMLPTQRWEVSAIISLIETANQFFDKRFYGVYALIKEHITQLVGNLPEVSETCAGLGWRVCDDALEKRRYNRKLQRVEVRTLVPQMKEKSDHLGDYNALSKCLLNMERRHASLLEEVIPKLGNRVAQRLPITQVYNRAKSMILNPQNVSEKHLETSPRRGALTLKRRWVIR